MKTGRIYLFVLFVALSGMIYAQEQAGDLQARILSARNRVMPALVHIEPVRSYYSTGEKRHTLVTGSGFIFSDDGYILTNHHVVENAEKVHCTLSNKKKLSARVVGSDPSTDVAVLQLNLEEWNGDPLPFTRLGNSDSLEVGQIVLALGSPLGLSRSVSMGVISSIDRYFPDQGQMISPYNLWIQTDAAINPGNSGGPLINLNGEVVGINSRGVFMAENLGFAIPVNLAREVSRKLINGSKIRRSWIGVELQPVKELREYLNKPDLQGVLVAGTEPHSPAVKANLEAGDVIAAINGRRVNADFEEDLPAVRKIIADLPVDGKVGLQVWRDGKMRNVWLKTQLDPFEYLPEFECAKLGVVVKSITREIFKAQELTDYDGVYISAVKNGEPGDKAGLQAGDIIRYVNQQTVKNMKSCRELYRQIVDSGPEYVFMEVRRRGASYFAALNLKKQREPEY